MVWWIANGIDSTANDLPWYAQMNWTCPRCGASFRLQEQDFIAAGPFVGSALDRRLAWAKTSSTGTATPNEYDPDVVTGMCFYCGLYPLTKNGPHYGGVHTAGDHDSTIGILAQYVNAGVNAATFFRTNLGDLVAVFLVKGAPYLPDATGLYGQAMRRTGAETFDTAFRYLFASPAVPLTPAQAQGFDPAFATTLIAGGLALI